MMTRSQMVFLEGGNTVAHIILRNTQSPDCVPICLWGEVVRVRLDFSDPRKHANWEGACDTCRVLRQDRPVRVQKLRKRCYNSHSDAHLLFRSSPVGIYLSGADSRAFYFLAK